MFTVNQAKNITKWIDKKVKLAFKNLSIPYVRVTKTLEISQSSINCCYVWKLSVLCVMCENSAFRCAEYKGSLEEQQLHVRSLLLYPHEHNLASMGTLSWYCRFHPLVFTTIFCLLVRNWVSEMHYILFRMFFVNMKLVNC